MADFNLAENLERNRGPLKSYMAREKPKLIDGVLNAGEFLSLELPEARTYIDPIVGERRNILLTGWRGVGKTWVGLSIVDCITRGIPFGPWPVRNAVSCLYLDGEMAVQDIQARYRGLNPYGDQQEPLRFYCDSYMNSLGLPRASLLNKRWRQDVKSLLNDLGVKVFVIDNIASLAGGIDENSKRDWDPVNQWLIDLRFIGITSILLHHTNKDGGQRGTSAREDNIDLSIMLKQPSDYSPDCGADFILSFNKTRVPLSDLKKMQDIRFTLTETNGVLSWQWREVKGEIRDEAIRMIDQGMDYKDIAAALGISKGRISQIKSDAMKAGILDAKGRLKSRLFD
jgi:putative DNA primase/helicase